VISGQQGSDTGFRTSIRRNEPGPETASGFVPTRWLDIHAH